MVKHIVYFGIAAFLFVVAGAASSAEDEAFTGNWRMESASFPVPESCAQMLFRFRNGEYEGDDGHMVLRLRYSVATTGRMHLLRFSYLSDNGRHNCQGRPPEYVRRNQAQSALIEVVSSDLLKMYFGETQKAPYVMLVRDQ
jgi:hypothetical protein